MIKEVIILAGGLGTRIRGSIGEIPKPMADINGNPFLEYLLNYLLRQGIEKVILSVGYKYEIIQSYFLNSYKEIKIIYSVEEEPLGTGGAIKKSLNYSESEDVFILNGDTLFLLNLKNFYIFHKQKESVLSIALKPISEGNRYGSVEIDKESKIRSFKEKVNKKNEVLINGGVYLLNRDFFNSLKLPEKFSFEKDFLEKYFTDYPFYGFVTDSYFIDIGIPEDYKRAKYEFKNFSFW